MREVDIVFDLPMEMNLFKSIVTSEHDISLCRMA